MLTGSDVNAPIREELSGKISHLKAEKERIRSQKEPIFNKLQATQNLLKSKIEELRSSKEKALFKRPEDIDRKIEQMEADIESGALKLIDEKKLVAEISKLRKLRRSLDSFSDHESSIADLKKASDQYRAILAEKDKELRGLDEQLKVVHAELVKLTSTRTENQGKIKALIKERDALREKTNGLYGAKNAAYEEFQKAYKAHGVFLAAERVKWEEAAVRREIETAVRDLERDLRHLEMPACVDQIEQCLNIQAFLRTNVLKEPVVPCPAASASVASDDLPSSFRRVEKVSDDMILKKDQIEDHYSIVGGSKKASKAGTKKSDSSVQQSTGPSKLKLPFWVLSGLEELNINMVSNVDDARTAIKALEDVKLAFEAKQKEKLATIDAEKSQILARIEKQKAQLDLVPQEAERRLKKKSAERAAAEKAAASPSNDATVTNSNVTSANASTDAAVLPTSSFNKDLSLEEGTPVVAN